MPEPVTSVRIFVASPGDVQKERRVLGEVVEDLQHGIGREKGLALELVKWETHTYPAMGRPQGLVNTQVGEYDIFIGIMWQRIGSPTGKAESGTVEEFERAYARWQQTHRPPILFYFSEQPAPPPTSEAEAEQLMKVARFRERVAGSGLIGTYADVEAFRRKVFRDLEKVLRTDILTPRSTEIRPPETSRTSLPTNESDVLRRFGHLHVPKRKRAVTDLDRREFLSQGFDTILAYFKEAGRAWEAEDSAVWVSIEHQDNAFTCEVFVHGNIEAQCKIWMRPEEGMSSIAYAEGRRGLYLDGSMNDWISVREGDDGLAFSPSGLNFLTSPDQSMTPHEAAEYLWKRVTQHL